MATITFQQARDIVEREVCSARRPLETETVPLAEALGRILADAVGADREYPPFDRATRDGFAVRGAETPGRLRVIGQVRAGQEFGQRVEAGEAVEIMTGAPVPAVADAVVMEEYTRRDGPDVAVERGARPG